MFDIGFFEFCVIGVVALVVIGPERLPGVARTIGHLLGRAQRYVNEVKADIEREASLAELNKLRDELKNSAQEVQAQVRDNFSSFESDMSNYRDEIKALADDAPAQHQHKVITHADDDNDLFAEKFAENHIDGPPANKAELPESQLSLDLDGTASNTPPSHKG